MGQVDQAVLDGAFRGELVPQDPDDQLAPVLLDRIRPQGAARTPAKGKQKGKQMRLPTVQGAHHNSHPQEAYGERRVRKCQNSR